MADTSAPARPTNLRMSADTVARRILILRCSSDASARMCAAEAEAVLARWDAEEVFPYPASAVLPSTFLESASMWVDRGRAHAFGSFTPEGW